MSCGRSRMRQALPWIPCLYELRVSIADGGALDLSEAEKEIKISVVLAK